MKKTQTQKTALPKILGYYLLGVMAGIMGIVATARLIWHSKYYPGVLVGGVFVGGLSREQASARVKETMDAYKLTLVYNGRSYELGVGEVPVELEASLNEAYRVGRRARLEDYLLILINRHQDYPLVLYEGESEGYRSLTNQMASEIEIAGVEASIENGKNGVKIVNGSDGVALDVATLNQAVRERVMRLEPTSITIPIQTVYNSLREEELEKLSEVAEQLKGKSLTLVQDDTRINLREELTEFLATKPGMIGEVADAKVKTYVEGIAESLRRESENARFEFTDGKVTEFAPGRDGIVVNVEETVVRLEEGIKELIETESKTVDVTVTVSRKPPQVTIDKLNELGIKQRIGRGESDYDHSIPNRIFNVSLASERLNSALVAPGETASFNNLVGEVSGATGYRAAYVIANGRTELGDGGGLCQVSTTMFRAAMNAGLPIVERWAHAYRVSYYELDSKPGVDATVYAPSKDLKFVNDTPGHILIQTINDPKNLHLIVEIYGTSDGRVATINNHKVWGITPPLPTIYQDDPSLPAGTTKQVDWAAPGAKASFEYSVMRDGEVIQEKTFSSSYRPWASVFLRGVGGQ